MSKKYPKLTIKIEPQQMEQETSYDELEYLGDNKWKFKMSYNEMKREEEFDSSSSCLDFLELDESCSHLELEENLYDYILQNIKEKIELEKIIDDLSENIYEEVSESRFDFYNSIVENKIVSDELKKKIIIKLCDLDLEKYSILFKSSIEKMDSNFFYELLSQHYEPIELKNYILTKSDIIYLNQYFSKTDILNYDFKNISKKLNDEWSEVKKKYTIKIKIPGGGGITKFDSSKLSKSEMKLSELVKKINNLSVFNKLMVE